MNTANTSGTASTPNAIPNNNSNNQQWNSLSQASFNAPTPNEVLTEIANDIDKADVSIIERLNANNDRAAKEEFLQNPDLVHPNNEYGNLDLNEIQNNLAALADIRKRIDQAELSEQQKRLLDILYEHAYKTNDFLLANFEYNNASTPEEKLEAAKHHREANEALYGKIDEDTFYALLQEKLATIDVAALSPEDRERYDKLLSDIGPLKETVVSRFKPQPETVQIFGEYIREFYKDFLKHIPADQEEFTGEDMARIVNEILTEEFSDEPDSNATPFQAIIDSSRGSASVNCKNHQIIFTDQKTYSRDKAAAIIIHELGVHALRSIPYTEQTFKPFSTGFPDNEDFDEGIAKCVEQGLAGEYSDSGIDHYINIGLATFKGKNFREVYDIKRTIQYLAGKTEKNLLTSVQRCFRGTGELVNNKDLVYYNGSEMAWKYIEEHLDNPVELFDNLFLNGKTAIVYPDHELATYGAHTGAYETPEQ